MSLLGSEVSYAVNPPLAHPSARPSGCFVPQVLQEFTWVLQGYYGRPLGWEAENDCAVGVKIRAPCSSWLQRTPSRLQVCGKTANLRLGLQTHLLGDLKAPLVGAGLQGEFSRAAD